MKKSSRLFFFVIIFMFCLTLVGCSKSKIDDLKGKGYIISVRYEANGGTYLDREGITVVDMFNPADYSKDSSGEIHIKLVEPTDKTRPAGGQEGIYITRTNYFLVGWYKNREIKKVNDKVVDEKGNYLVLKDGKYYLESDDTKEASPAYDYSGYWDFTTDTLDYKDDMGEYELTLYAVWSEYFKFDYYYLDGSDWKLIEGKSTVFDYVTTNKVGSTTADKDTIYLPCWENGAMNYSHKYMNNSIYNFPKVSGYTFNSAYLDKDCTVKIDSSYEHTGSIDYSTGKAINPVNNIYIKLDKGELYHISEASQLIDNANANGIYIIEADLDFEGLAWPSVLAYNVFNGQMYGKDGVNYTLSNITITHNSDSSKNGGLFGQLSKDSVVKDLTFSNVTLDISNAGRRNRDTYFGLFAGFIDDNANVSNVKLSGNVKIGAITLGDNYSINTVANGDNTKVTVDGIIKVYVYGIQQGTVYSYTVNPDTVKVSEFGDITFESVTGMKKESEKYEIQ